jgi:hypothetical protein
MLTQPASELASKKGPPAHARVEYGVYPYVVPRSSTSPIASSCRCYVRRERGGGERVRSLSLNFWQAETDAGYCSRTQTRQGSHGASVVGAWIGVRLLAETKKTRLCCVVH